MRVLVTGSRAWTDVDFIEDTLDAVLDLQVTHPTPLTIVHGACPRGADYIAHQWALGLQALGYPVVVEPHPANWRNRGRGAGAVRNAEMVAMGADLCLAFICNNSRGATHCASLAQEAGIETRVYRFYGSRRTGIEYDD